MSLHHFSFSAPHYLFALLLVPLFYLFTVIVRRRRSQYTIAFTNLAMLAAVSKNRRNSWRYVPVILLGLALATSAAALARPHVQRTESDSGATVVLLADVSGSMRAIDIRPSRLAAAVSAMHAFLDELPKNDLVGLVTFSDKVEILHAPTTDRTVIASELDGLNPQGGTAAGEGVEGAVKLVVASLAAAGVRHAPGKYLPAAIVFESDGAQNRGTVSPFAAAQVAKEAGVRIYGVALGKRRGYITEGSGYRMLKIPVPSDPGLVGLFARETGGESFAATNTASLDRIYRNLGSSIGSHPVLADITSWFEIAAALLLVAGVGLSRARGAALP